MNLDKKKYCLILSKNFAPLKIVGVKKTMKYLLNEQGKALNTETFQLFSFKEWIACNNERDYVSTVRTEKLWILIPDVIVLNTDSFPSRSNTRILSKRKVYERDHNTCGYCETSLNSHNRTIDHIIPKSRGGAKHDYKNIVSCCSKCNREKGNKTLEELGWELKFKITNPTNSILALVPPKKWLPSWKPFIPELKD